MPHLRFYSELFRIKSEVLHTNKWKTNAFQSFIVSETDESSRKQQNPTKIMNANFSFNCILILPPICSQIRRMWRPLLRSTLLECHEDEHEHTNIWNKSIQRYMRIRVRLVCRMLLYTNKVREIIRLST